MRPAFFVAGSPAGRTRKGDDMNQVLTRDTLFKPNKSKSENKADTTTQVARAIMDDETARREAKTERLRAARVAAEEKAEPKALPAKPRKAPARKKKA